MRRQKTGRKWGNLIFLLPVIVIAGLVAYQLINVTFFNDGTLNVQALTSDKFYPSESLAVTASVGGQTGTTPFSVSLPQGTYSVTFDRLQWYWTPSPRQAVVPAGSTAYATGVYSPIQRVIMITQDKFNVTEVTAMHDVTPVTWENSMANFTILVGSPFGKIILTPGENYTYVYQNQGSFSFSLSYANAGGVVQVS